MKLKRLKKIAMKLFCGMLITILFASIVVARPSVGQSLRTTDISLSFENTSLKKVLKAIEKQTNCSFFYDDNLVQSLKKISIKLENKNLDEILDVISKETNVQFLQIDKSIAIKQANTPSQLQDSTITVTGKVVDAKTNNPLPGVSIYIKGSTNGTISDADGNYRVIVPSTRTILRFSFIGYEQQETTIGQQSVINIALVDAAAILKDVVVIGYGQNSRKQLASAVSTVTPDDLNQGAITDVGQLLQGKVAGFNITASGNPNKAAAVLLRGASTLNSSQSPLYVIDGIPDADIATVSMDDIASIDVLKDAAATSIYGNRAANGVIIITTKHGKNGQTQISINSYTGIEKVSNQLKMMNADELRTFVETNGQAFSSTDDQGYNTDWQKAIERNTAISQSHNLSFSGGTENHNYSTSLTYQDKQGIILTSNLSRFIARVAMDQYAINHKLKFGVLVSNSYSLAHNVPQLNVALLQAVKHLPISPIKDADGAYFENFDNSNYFNPVAIINHGKDDTKYNKLAATATAHAQLPLGLTYDLRLSYQNSTSLHGEYYDSYYSQYTSYHFYSNPDPPATRALVDFGTNGSALRNTYQNTAKILETFLTWNKTFGSHSNVNAVVGYAWQENVNGEGFQATTTNFISDEIGYENLAMSNYSAVSDYTVNFGSSTTYYKTRLISDFARLNYSFKDKYLMQASIRRDGSSVFGTNNHWGYFPSLGVAWRISQEGFMQGQDICNDLKLRFSYGVTGNSSGFNAYTAQFISSNLATYYYNGSQIAAYGPSQAANADLKWEKTATTNIGLDFTVLNNNISGSVEWYDKKTDGMITSYEVDPILVPQGNITANGGKMNNKGIEVSLNATPVKSNTFSWTTNLNLAHNVNKIVSLTNPLYYGGDSVCYTQPDGLGQTGSTLQIYKAGKPLGQFFTLLYAGKDADGVSQYIDADGNLTTSPSTSDYHYAGSPQPKLLLGWNNTFRYRNFDLNVFIRGVFGNKIFNVTRADLFRPTTAYEYNILKDAAGESVKDGNAYKYSSRFIEDGSYIRFDNATLGYTFKDIIQYVKTIKLYVTVNNLFVITKYKGIDPEINQGGNALGIDSNNFYPKTRTVLFGINVSFN
jgi:TonB-dependent starch-binding outer membrane protein SusC